MKLRRGQRRQGCFVHTIIIARCIQTRLYLFVPFMGKTKTPKYAFSMIKRQGLTTATSSNPCGKHSRE